VLAWPFLSPCPFGTIHAIDESPLAASRNMHGSFHPVFTGAPGAITCSPNQRKLCRRFLVLRLRFREQTANFCCIYAI
jgi:hypothetical protein